MQYPNHGEWNPIEKSLLARLPEEVISGRSDGKIIWPPRIGCWYTDKQFAGEPLPALCTPVC